MSRFLILFLSVGVVATLVASEEMPEVADYRAQEAELVRRSAKSVIDANTVVRLGYELPDEVVVGAGGRPQVLGKGVLAQCALGKPKRFELRTGGTLNLGRAGFRFDSNYARGGTNEVVFAGGTISSFEPSFLRSAAPIKVTISPLFTSKEIPFKA